MAAQLAGLAGRRSRVRAAGARLRGRALRLPALGRRRLRQGERPAVGDGIPEGDGAHQRRGPPDTDLRDAVDGDRGARAVAPARPPDRRAAVRAVPDPGRNRAPAGRVRQAQRPHRGRAHASPAPLDRDGRRRGSADRPYPAAPPAACMTRARSALHLLALSSLAIGQPLLVKLGPAPGYFAAHHLSSLEVVLFALGVLLVPPLVLAGLEVLTGLAGEPVRRAVHLVFVAGLVALIAVPTLGALPTALAYGCAFVIGGAAAAAYARW